jgi:hypothetical protein
MTIAACYLSSEGVVFGADSTTTVFVQGPDPAISGTDHYYNYAQKIFQIGEDSNLGMTMWGLGSLGETSYRTLIARFADTLAAQPPGSMGEVADRWNAFYWNAYSSRFAPFRARLQHLRAQATRSPEEEAELRRLEQNLSGGFCIGGYCLPDRDPGAYEIIYELDQTGPQPPKPLEIGASRFWGCPNIMARLLFGIDLGLFASIQQSPLWAGSELDLYKLVFPYYLAQPFDLPMRDAIDWVYTSIYTTSQAMKFSHLAPVCGGPVEIAVISTDRHFRWVRHKMLDAAISQGGFSHGP